MGDKCSHSAGIRYFQKTFITGDVMAIVSDNAQFQKDKYICIKLYACSMEAQGILQGQ